MNLSLDENHAKYQIRGFTPGTIQVNEQTFTQSIIIAPDTLITNWPPQHIEELQAKHVDILAASHPSIILIGTGTTLIFPSIDIYGHLLNRGIGVEIMDTAAACRTYNALTSENRKVVAGLIIQ